MARHDQKEKPQRSCLGCRESRDKNSLIRFVLSPQSEVVPDLTARLPGRGAYACISAECVAAAVKQRQFNRAFKKEVNVLPAEELNELIARQMREHILGYLGLANRAGKIVSGGSLVSDAIRSRTKPGLVLVARDVSEAIGEKIEQLAGVHGIPCARVLTKDDLGAILGKAPRSAVAVKDGGFVARIADEINRYRNFLGEV
ncbi:DUF448 domain-containing protein [Geobacter sp. SVR]|uniref:DUF448 domain-containing protein n=1 Tax=Geobacter sp. SVR TaxID=2495594 RepID=UPI00143F0022|nr:DUF448 domain-containing protein [Geobacter sp. SVR]BCS53442.1 50S ribosomal protein L7/L12 [Geobacter sp. SVR]GCF85431.1 50S ribosomal protein L7/L12 [Geobacter sp. SVR]